MKNELFNSVEQISQIDELIEKLDNITAGAGAFLMAFLVVHLIFQYLIH